MLGVSPCSLVLAASTDHEVSDLAPLFRGPLPSWREASPPFPQPLGFRPEPATKVAPAMVVGRPAAPWGPRRYAMDPMGAAEGSEARVRLRCTHIYYFNTYVHSIFCRRLVVIPQRSRCPVRPLPLIGRGPQGSLVWVQIISWSSPSSQNEVSGSCIPG